MQQISPGEFIEWETVVYFCQFFAPFLSISLLTNSALVLEKFFDGKLRFDEDFQNVEVEVKKNSQKFLGPFSPVELAHWEKGY